MNIIKNAMKSTGVFLLSSPFVVWTFKEYPVEHWFDYITMLLLSAFFIVSAIMCFYFSERKSVAVISLFLTTFVSYMISLFLIKGNVPFILFFFVGVLIMTIVAVIYFGLKEIKRVELIKKELINDIY